MAQGQSALVELQGNDAVLFAKADLSAANSAVRGGSGTTTSVVFSSQTASGSTQLASPQLAGIPGVISSQIVLGNTASTSIRAELTVINDNGTSADMMTLQIPANSAVSTVFDGSTVDSSVRGASGLVGSLVIEASAPGLLGTVVFNTADAAAALPLQSAPFNEAVFAQVAELDDFFTGLALFNPPGPVQPGLKGVPPGTAQVTVTVLNPDGTQVGSSTVSLADGARMAQVVTELVSEAAGIVGGSIRLSSTEAIYAQVIFGRTGFLSVVPPIGLD